MLKKELKPQPRRVIVIGSPGSGKSTFSRKLRDKTGLPLYYLDMIFHNPDRTTVSREEFDQSLSEILNTDQWIIDGNYQRTLPLRFEKCTEVCLFDLPAEECLAGADSRVGQIREDMPWIETEFDPEFRKYILDFRKDQMPGINELIEQYKDIKKITVFYSREEADKWLNRYAEKMMVELRAVTEENFIDAFNLRLAPGQENFVSHPIRSLAQAYVYRNQCQPFGIYAEDKMIGYVMVIYDYDIPEYDIWHMMIDESMQGRGYGSEALERVIEYIRTKPFGDSDRVALTCNKNNLIARKLYESKGFSATGAEDDDEIELVMTV